MCISKGGNWCSSYFQDNVLEITYFLELQWCVLILSGQSTSFSLHFKSFVKNSLRFLAWIIWLPQITCFESRKKERGRRKKNARKESEKGNAMKRQKASKLCTFLCIVSLAPLPCNNLDQESVTLDRFSTLAFVQYSPIGDCTPTFTAHMNFPFTKGKNLVHTKLYAHWGAS